MEVQDATLARAVEASWRSAPLSDRQRTLAVFAEKLTRAPGSMEEGDLAPLRAAGLDDAGILDLVEVTAYFNYINRIADGLGVDLEPFMDPSKTPQGP